MLSQMKAAQAKVYDDENQPQNARVVTWATVLGIVMLFVVKFWSSPCTINVGSPRDVNAPTLPERALVTP